MEQNTEVTTQETQQTEEKTFTQAELNAIVQKRVGEVTSKYANYEELKEKAQRFDQIEEDSKSELQKANEKADSLQSELDALKAANRERELKEKISAETGVPAGLLRGTSEEDLKAQAEAIAKYAKSNKGSYPQVQDSGETIPPRTTKAEILSIKNEKERLKAIEENIELFD